MSLRGGIGAILCASLASACRVPLEHYFHTDAGQDALADAADAILDAAPDAGLDATPQADATLSLLFGQRAYAKASNTGTGDAFGQAIDLADDGVTLAIGAPLEDSNGINPASNAAADAGAVYVLARSGGSWTQQAYLKAASVDGNDFFGRSVALSGSGTTLVIGAPSEDSNATVINGDATNNDAGGAGAAYVFTRQGTAWSQETYLKPSNTDSDDDFGRSVALSADGSTIAVGAPREDSDSTTDPTSNASQDAGAVYVFVRSGATWIQQAYLKASPPIPFDQFGNGVALSADGSTLAITASRDDSVDASPGKVYVFIREGTSWTRQFEQPSFAAGAQGAFGNAVSLSASGSVLAVGAAQEPSPADAQLAEAGAVYLFRRTGSQWSTPVAIEPPTTGAGDRFGTSVALSADGSALAVGVALEDSGATGINGDQASNATADSGAVYLFSLTETTTGVRSYVKPSNTSPGDQFGSAVALSDSGAVLAAGASLEDSLTTGINGEQNNDNALDAGAVFLFGVE